MWHAGAGTTVYDDVLTEEALEEVLHDLYGFNTNMYRTHFKPCIVDALSYVDACHYGHFVRFCGILSQFMLRCIRPSDFLFWLLSICLGTHFCEPSCVFIRCWPIPASQTYSIKPRMATSWAIRKEVRHYLAEK